MVAPRFPGCTVPPACAHAGVTLGAGMRPAGRNFHPMRILRTLAFLWQASSLLAVPCVPGTVTTLAGGENTTAAGKSDGVGSAALFTTPYSASVDGSGMIFVADTDNNMIRALNASTGKVTRLAGGGGAGAKKGLADGVGSAALFDAPRGVTVDGAAGACAAAVVFVGDTYNNVVRAVDVASRAVTTLAGGGSAAGKTAGYADGLGSAALFNQPTGLAAQDGVVYVADQTNNLVRAVVAGTGAVTTLAGGGGAGGTASGYADGVGSAAFFSSPFAVSVDGAGLLYVSDTENSLLRAIALASAVVTTVAGGGCAGCTDHGFVDGLGSAAQFSYPYGLAADGNFVYIGDSNNHVIRAVVLATGAVTTLAGGGGGGGTEIGCADGVGTAALLHGWGLALHRLNYSSSGGRSFSSGGVILADFTNNRIRSICPLALPSPQASPSPGALPDARGGDIAGPLFGALGGAAVFAVLVGGALLFWRRGRPSPLRQRQPPAPSSFRVTARPAEDPMPYSSERSGAGLDSAASFSKIKAQQLQQAALCGESS